MSSKMKTAKAAIRCAIYTRKSTDEGLEQEFNSLDAQREAAEAFIASQKAEGWAALPDRYDDGGYSGGSMERPALDRLLRDITEGKVDCVVVYKVDRLSRSLLDFARIMETFDNRGVSFVSVTQQFNTTHSMGRLTLNILLSFAQFEREIIGERIRDKLAAQARKGKWTGGTAVLGYDVDRSGPSPRLVVNAQEAHRVREIYRMYLHKGALLPMVKELARRGWVNKRRVTKKGRKVGGRAFDRSSLHVLLTNPTYIGLRRYKDELHPGEHEAIIDRELFDKVQQQLKHNGRTGGTEVRNKYGALLRGLLRCKSCGTAMTHTFCRGRNKRRFYRYYRCTKAIKSGADGCTAGTLPAAEMERVVIDEIRALTNDEALLAQVLAEANAAIDAERAEAERRRDDLRRECKRYQHQLQQLSADGNGCDVESGGGDSGGESAATRATAHPADLHEHLATAAGQLAELEQRIAELKKRKISPGEARAAFADFNRLWESLIPREQARLLRLLISEVVYDGTTGSVSITFRPTSIRSLIDRKLEDAA